MPPRKTKKVTKRSVKKIRKTRSKVKKTQTGKGLLKKLRKDKNKLSTEQWITLLENKTAEVLKRKDLTDAEKQATILEFMKKW